MQIEVENLSRSAIGDVERRILNARLPVVLADTRDMLTTCIGQRFSEAWEDNLPLLRDLLPVEKVRIVLRADLCQPVPSILGAYDLFASVRHEMPCFWVSSHLVFDDLLADHGLPRTGLGQSTHGVWTHELLHLADRDALTRVYRLQADDENPARWETDSLLGQPAPPREWVVLGMLAQWRAEGLASLYECLRGLRPVGIAGTQARESAHAIFEALEPWLAAPPSVRARMGDANDRASRLLETARSWAYQGGPFLALDALRVLHADAGTLVSCKDLDRVVALLEQDASPDLDAHAAAELIRPALRADLSVFIDALVRPGWERPWGEFLRTDELAGLLHEIAGEGGDDDGAFVRRVLSAVATRDRSGFLRALQEQVGALMQDRELEKAQTDWLERVRARMAARTVTSLEEEALRRIAPLHAALRALDAAGRRDAALIARASLTYLFDPEDYVDDETRLLGYWEDVLVLRGAAALLGTEQGQGRARN